MTGLLHVTAEATARRYYKPWAAALVIATGGIVASVTGYKEGGAQFAAQFAFWASVGVGIAVPAGIISGERASGVILLWAQQPGSLLKFYTRRMLLVQVVTLGLVLPFGVTVAGALLVQGEPVGVALRYGVGVALVGVLCGFITITFSAWGIVKDSFLALLWTIVSFMLGGLLLMDAVRAGETTWIRYVIFPVDALQQLSTGSAIGEGLATIFGQMVAFAIIAGLGLVWLDRRPLPSSSFEVGD